MLKFDLQKIEEAALNAWPAPRQILYDGWVLRFTGGHSKRVNSVNPLYPSRLPLNEKIEACEGLYARLGLPCLFRVPDYLEGSTLVEALYAAGYTAFDPTLVLGQEVLKKPQNGPVPSIQEIPVAEWFRLRAAFINVPEEDQRAHHAILACIVPEKVLLGLFDQGQPVGCGMGVAEGQLIGFFSIYIAAGWRRKGYATMMMDALTDWGLVHGANFGYLQVEADNLPALALYAHLGFTPCYQYVYFGKQGAHDKA